MIGKASVSRDQLALGRNYGMHVCGYFPSVHAGLVIALTCRPEQLADLQKDKPEHFKYVEVTLNTLILT